MSTARPHVGRAGAARRSPPTRPDCFLMWGLRPHAPAGSESKPSVRRIRARIECAMCSGPRVWAQRLRGARGNAALRRHPPRRPQLARASDERALRAAPHPPARICFLMWGLRPHAPAGRRRSRPCAGLRTHRVRNVLRASRLGATAERLARGTQPYAATRPAVRSSRERRTSGRCARLAHPPARIVSSMWGCAPTPPRGRSAPARHGSASSRSLVSACAERRGGRRASAWGRDRGGSGPAPEAPLSGRVAESVQCRSGGGVGAEPPQRRNPGAGGWASRALRALLQRPCDGADVSALSGPAALRPRRPPSPSGRRRPASRPRRSAGTAQ